MTVKRLEDDKKASNKKVAVKQATDVAPLKSAETCSLELKWSKATDVALFKGAETPSGFEETTGDSYKTPFVKILQDLSPEIKKGADRVAGAETGQLFNTATREFKDAMNIIVLKVTHALVVWQPKRGGFVGRFVKAEESKIVYSVDGMQKKDKHGNDIVDTMEFYCIDADNPQNIFILPMSMSSFKHARSFNTRLRQLTLDGRPVGVSWAGVWNISTVEEQNDKGSWYTVGNTPSFERFITEEERNEFVLPALKMLSSLAVDYKVLEDTDTIKYTAADEDDEEEIF